MIEDSPLEDFLDYYYPNKNFSYLTLKKLPIYFKKAKSHLKSKYEIHIQNYFVYMILRNHLLKKISYKQILPLVSDKNNNYYILSLFRFLNSKTSFFKELSKNNGFRVLFLLDSPEKSILNKAIISGNSFVFMLICRLAKIDLSYYDTDYNNFFHLALSQPKECFDKRECTYESLGILDTILNLNIDNLDLIRKALNRPNKNNISPLDLAKKINLDLYTKLLAFNS